MTLNVVLHNHLTNTGMNTSIEEDADLNPYDCTKKFLNDADLNNSAYGPTTLRVNLYDEDGEHTNDTAVCDEQQKQCEVKVC